jgi:phenylpropionate dioxygenase-like ring-hydroxylating dioxygenase large terminal subunit
MVAEIEDRWVPIGLERDIQPLSSHPVVVDNFRIAVWRSVDGPVQVWEDRCPHRGMRLSFGFVRRNRLTCLYHGWTYEEEGSCVSIPAHPDLQPPKTICTNSFPVAGSRGIIYTNLSAQPAANFSDMETGT